MIVYAGQRFENFVKAWIGFEIRLFEHVLRIEQRRLAVGEAVRLDEG